MHVPSASARTSAFLTAELTSVAALRRGARRAANTRSQPSSRTAPMRSGAARAELSPDVAQNVVNSITGTIKFGAPMFNKGDAKGCAKLYRQTAMGIIRDTAVTSDQIKTCLRDAVAEADAISDSSSGDAADNKIAWTLRRGLDTAVNLILDPPPDEPMIYAPEAAGASGKDTAAMDGEGGEEEDKGKEDTFKKAQETPTVDEAQLFDFAASPQIAGRWRSLNDGIMGGVSDGAMTALADGTGARFTGVVRLENNGGFASVRVSFGSGIDISQFKGLYLDVRPGDTASGKKKYLVVIKDEECMTTQVNFKAAFSCEAAGSSSGKDDDDAGGWGRVRVPFTAFDRPERMGRAVMRGALRTEAVCELGLMVLKGSAEQTGPFKLDIRAMGAYK